MNTDKEILNKILENFRTQEFKIINYDQMSFILRMQSWFNTYKAMNTI